MTVNWNKQEETIKLAQKLRKRGKYCETDKEKKKKQSVKKERIRKERNTEGKK